MNWPGPAGPGDPAALEDARDRTDPDGAEGRDWQEPDSKMARHGQIMHGSSLSVLGLGPVVSVAQRRQPPSPPRPGDGLTDSG